ncbi:MAG: 5'-nucleotidase C-terminal domain-containing protein [Phocaeicola sp.]
MNVKETKKCFSACLMAMAIWLTGCQSSYSVVGVEGGRVTVTSSFDEAPHAAAQQLVQHYKATVDSIMSPVIGNCTVTLEAKKPESPLSNLLADILRNGATPYIGKPADVGVMNMGGIRNVLPAGPIRFSDVFQVAPFENTLSILEMSGSNLRKLFHQIAANNGEGLSGATLVITENRELVSATVAGKELVDEQLYYVATIDYVADGNNGMEAFRDAASRVEPDGETIRKLFLDYVHQITQAGKSIEAKVEGRISIKK